MGGNIFKNARRFAALDFYPLALNIQNRMSRIHNDRLVQILPAYSKKESFGDLDIVVAHPRPDDIIKEFGLTPEDWSKNGNVFSFLYEGLQVDVIGTNEDTFHTSLNYFAYNDMQNILGRIFHKLGIKLGHRGLYLMVREPEPHGGHLLTEILLSDDFREILDIIGLDYATWNKGFDDLEDIFKFVASSKYFDPEIYLLENRSHHARIRDKKRKTYHEFLEWLRTHEVKGNYSFPEKSERGGYSIREPFYTDIVLKLWPWAENSVNIAIQKHEQHVKFKKVFNGNVVAEYYGIEKGPKLREVMTKLNLILTDDLREKMITPKDVEEFLKNAGNVVGVS